MLTSDLFNSVNRITLKGISFQLREVLNIMSLTDPITGRQIDFIEDLIEDRGTNVQCVLGEAYKEIGLEQPPQHLADLNRGQASKLIDWLTSFEALLDPEEEDED